MGIWLLTYNSRHQQTKVETESGNVQENRYDVENLRFELLENGKRTGFVYHDGELLHEEGREEKRASYHLGAGIAAFQRGQELYYYQQDEQLNAVFITGGNGEIQNSYLYDAFGTEVETKEQFPNLIRYTGQQYDDMTEQYYLRARYYNPILGRFIQEDVYQGDGLNLYAYCGNNPVVYYDPTGYAGASQQLGYGCPPNGNIGGDGDNVDESGIQPDYYVSPQGDAIPSLREQFDNNLSLMNENNGKYIGETSNGPVRVRVEGAHEPTLGYLGSTDNDHLVDHIHVEHRQNGFTGAWGRGSENKISLPQDWLR